jgi:hypothetical protein
MARISRSSSGIKTGGGPHPLHRPQRMDRLHQVRAAPHRRMTLVPCSHSEEFARERPADLSESEETRDFTTA